VSEIRFVDVPVAVEARFDEDGSLTPIAFTWQGQKLRISDVGRRWTEDNVRHYLVMTSAQETFELCFDVSTLRWRIARIWARAKLA